MFSCLRYPRYFLDSLHSSDSSITKLRSGVPAAHGSLHIYSKCPWLYTVYPKKYAHGFVVLCFVVVMQSFIRNSHEVFNHIHQGCFAGTEAIVRLPQCQWSKPDGYGKISQCITTTKHSKAKTVCIFFGIYCRRILKNIVWSEKPIQPMVTPKFILGVISLICVTFAHICNVIYSICAAHFSNMHNILEGEGIFYRCKIIYCAWYLIITIKCGQLVWNAPRYLHRCYQRAVLLNITCHTKDTF